MSDNIFQLKKRRKWLPVIVWWFCGLALAVISCLNDNNIPAESFQCANNFLDDTPIKSQMGAMSYFSRDPANNGRPLYSVKFDELNTAKGQLGIFKTGVYKIAKVNGLQLKRFQYSTEKKTVPANVSNEYSDSELFDELLEKAGELSNGRYSDSSGEFSDNLRDGWKLTIPGFELSDIGEIRISNFDYQVFYDEKLSFGVQGKVLIASYKQQDVILRGHVIITASDGSRLECNYAKWNVKKELFEIDGVYILNRGGEIISGKYICVDTQLNPVEVKHAKSKQKEIKKCFAKLP